MFTSPFTILVVLALIFAALSLAAPARYPLCSVAVILLAVAVLVGPGK